MLKTGCGEFCISSYANSIIFYKTSNGFFKDIFKKDICSNCRTIEITKEEYFKKLKHFMYLLEKEN